MPDKDNLKSVFSSSFKTINYKEFSSFERTFLTSIVIIGIFISGVGSIINIFLGFQTILIIFTVSAFFIYTAILILLKRSKYILWLKWIFISFTLFMMNFLWFYNYGSKGPAPYFFVLLYSVMIFLLHGKQNTLMTIVLVLNIIIIAVIDITHPGITGQYETILARKIDVYTGILMYLILIFGLMNLAKQSYINQYYEAKNSEKLKSIFLANLSHEIRTPMNAILGFSELIAQDEIDEDSKNAYAKIIDENGNSLLKLIDNILEISKIESNQLKLNIAELHLTDVMKSMENIIKRKIEESKKQLKLTISKPEDQIHIHSDKFILEKILFFILENAVKFSDSGEIIFSCKHEKRHIIFMIKDFGIGIDKSIGQNVFNIFSKSEKNISTNILNEGAGLSLYLARAFTDKLNGHIWYKSNDEEPGTTFYLSIPERLKSN
ncbi:histidine kinase dimerization/phospho-acceptor domain-containing protein [Saccharicrinis sp. FJH62]|uniref:sensor histidine kinase n=1 Tax=Saccharicrinis sp. FJH62 TaxID=3344657 RepID=UPI0035D4392D